jgi:hypothetical protein
MAAKYIRTQYNEIIVFCEYLVHVEFNDFEPKSAGFITFIVDSQGNPDCFCWGESASLNLKSIETEDTELARLQILGRKD